MSQNPNYCQSFIAVLHVGGSNARFMDLSVDLGIFERYREKGNFENNVPPAQKDLLYPSAEEVLLMCIFNIIN